MGETECVELGDARAADSKLFLVLGDQNLPMALEAAIVVEEFGNLLPDPHRTDRQRDLGNMPRELADAAGIDAGGLAKEMVQKVFELVLSSDSSVFELAGEGNFPLSLPAADEDESMVRSVPLYLS